MLRKLKSLLHRTKSADTTGRLPTIGDFGAYRTRLVPRKPVLTDADTLFLGNLAVFPKTACVGDVFFFHPVHFSTKRLSKFSIHCLSGMFVFTATGWHRVADLKAAKDLLLHDSGSDTLLTVEDVSPIVRREAENKDFQESGNPCNVPGAVALDSRGLLLSCQMVWHHVKRKGSIK